MTRDPDSEAATAAGREAHAREYASALARYLDEPTEAPLYEASLLAGRLVEAGMGPEDISALHGFIFEGTLAERGAPGGVTELVARAHRFLLEVMIHYGVRDREYQELKLQESLRAADEAARSEREKSSLLSSIAHEIGTPLTVAQGFARRAARIAQEREDLPQLADSLEETLRALEHLANLNRSLRHASTAGVPRDLDIAPQPIGRVLEPVTSWARLLADESGISFEQEINDPQDEVLCDADAFTTICNNLISNAVRYTHPGGRVTLRQDMVDGWVRIEVNDSGIGMSPQVQSQIFERFYRGPEAAQKSAKGLGLGLATTRSLVEAHDGRIEFESEPQKGSTFRVLFHSGRTP